MPFFGREENLKHRYGGPLGYGDPDDHIIKYNERFSVIPAFQREVIVHLYCSMQEDAYTNCCRDHPWTKALRCRRVFAPLKSCLQEYWNLPYVKELAEEVYLKERSMYRLTGLKKSERQKLVMQRQNNESVK